MRISRTILLIILLFVLVIAPALAGDTNVSFSNGLTFTTPYGFRFPLGLENIMPPSWAFLFYNSISLGLLFFIGGYASLRSTRFSIFCINGFAAIFWWFGWMNLYIKESNSVNWWTPLQLIILAGVMGGAIYLKEANRERYGTGGTGLTLINALYFFILLQTVIGFVNMTGLWATNSAVTPSEYQYNNVDVQKQVTNNSNLGGFMGGLISTATGLAALAVQSGQMILTVIQGICGYDTILFAAFPWITLSPIAMAFVWIFRIVILLLDAWFIFLIFFKPPPLDNLGV
ncbi:MAG: hypothetical protein WC558_07075 [Patulibacter sp.]